VLASFFEVNLHITWRLHELGRVQLWKRPIAMALLGLTLAGLMFPYFWGSRRRRGEVRP
jgi:TctA family transporter